MGALNADANVRSVTGNDTAPALQSPAQTAMVSEQADNTGFRVGVVNKIDNSGNVTVAIGGADTLINAAYLLGSYRPAGGDRVLLARIGASWVVMGALSTPPTENAVVNFSFEQDPINTSPPSGWNYINRAAGLFPGTPIVKVDFTTRAFHGQQSANVNGIAVASAWEQLLYSSPIPVSQNDLWTASAWYFWWNSSGSVFAQADLWLFWFADASTTPTFAPIDTPDLTTGVRLDESFVNNGPASEWVQLRQYINRTGTTIDPPGPFAVPVGKNYMRVVLRTKSTTGSTDIFFDRVTAVKVN